MNLKWSAAAQRDLVRLHNFLVLVNPVAAADARHALIRAAQELLEFPRMGSRLDDYEIREVRRLIVLNRYELRYEIDGESISVVRIFHAREDR